MSRAFRHGSRSQPHVDGGGGPALIIPAGQSELLLTHGEQLVPGRRRRGGRSEFVRQGKRGTKTIPADRKRMVERACGSDTSIPVVLPRRSESAAFEFRHLRGVVSDVNQVARGRVPSLMTCSRIGSEDSSCRSTTRSLRSKVTTNAPRALGRPCTTGKMRRAEKRSKETVSCNSGQCGRLDTCASRSSGILVQASQRSLIGLPLTQMPRSSILTRSHGSRIRLPFRARWKRQSPM